MIDWFNTKTLLPPRNKMCLVMTQDGGITQAYFSNTFAEPWGDEYAVDNQPQWWAYLNWPDTRVPVISEKKRRDVITCTTHGNVVRKTKGDECWKCKAVAFEALPPEDQMRMLFNDVMGHQFRDEP